jgi:hypothetical protein
MENNLYDEIVSIIETEVKRITSFLREHIKEYEIPTPNTEFIKKHINELQKKLSPTLEKNVEGLVYSLILPTWKTMFEIDNFIDTDKTLEEQKEIIQDLIESVENTGKITDKYIPTHLVEIVNRDFLVSDLKRRVLIAELNAELKLCNPEIDWIDAVAERMRVMHFSGALVIEISAINTLLDRLSAMMKDTHYNRLRNYIPKEVQIFGSKYLSLAKGYASYYFPSLEIKPEHPVEGWIRKIYDEVDIVELMKQLPISKKFPDLPNRNVTISDLIIPIAQMCGGVAIGDDYMDLEEDMRNNKVTGVTQAVKQGIPAKHVLSTACIYSQGIVEEHSFATETQRWFIELMGMLYHDQPECLRLCSEASPLIYNNLFQRK